MLGFRKKKTVEKKTFDSSRVKPVLKCSICTGEQVAGFVDLQTGKFDDVMLIRGAEELQEFLDMYGISDIEKIY